MESSLLNLDVFHHIGEHIAQKEALVALCSVCKDLNRIFTPRLYAHLRIHNIAMMKKFRGNDLNKTKYITLGEPLEIPTGEKVLPLPPILEQGPMFVPNGDTGLRLLDDDDVEGLLCGILLNCENLESLVIKKTNIFKRFCTPLFPGHIATLTMAEIVANGHLRTFVLEDAWTPCPPGLYPPLFQNLHKLALHRMTSSSGACLDAPEAGWNFLTRIAAILVASPQLSHLGLSCNQGENDFYQSEHVSLYGLVEAYQEALPEESKEVLNLRELDLGWQFLPQSFEEVQDIEQELLADAFLSELTDLKLLKFLRLRYSIEGSQTYREMSRPLFLPFRAEVFNEAVNLLHLEVDCLSPNAVDLIRHNSRLNSIVLRGSIESCDAKYFKGNSTSSQNWNRRLPIFETGSEWKYLDCSSMWGYDPNKLLGYIKLCVSLQELTIDSDHSTLQSFLDEVMPSLRDLHTLIVKGKAFHEAFESTDAPGPCDSIHMRNTSEASFTPLASLAGSVFETNWRTHHSSRQQTKAKLKYVGFGSHVFKSVVAAPGASAFCDGWKIVELWDDEIEAWEEARRQRRLNSADIVTVTEER